MEDRRDEERRRLVHNRNDDRLWRQSCNISPPRQENHEKENFALFTAAALLCRMLAGCGPTGSSSTHHGWFRDAKDT